MLICLIVSFCFIYSEIDNIRQSDVDFLSSIENESSSYILLNPTISAPVVDVNIPIRISFNDANILSHTIETEGLIATQVSEGAMEYDILSTEEYGVFSFMLHMKIM